MKTITSVEANLISIGIQFAVDHLNKSDCSNQEVAEEIAQQFIDENGIQEVTNNGIHIFGNRVDIMFLFLTSALTLICIGIIWGRWFM